MTAKTLVRRCTLTLWLAMSTSFALAQNAPLKAGQPCVEELCVGDDMLDLVDLPWETVQHPVPGVAMASATVSDKAMEHLHEILRADEDTIKAVAPYWMLRSFDANGLRALRGVRAVCGSLGVFGRMHAQYLSAEGDTTVVSFEPIPSDDGRRQSFRVATITRFFTRLDSPDAVAALGESIAQRYAGVDRFPSADRPGVRWRTEGDQGANLKLFAPIGDPLERAGQLRRHPACTQP